MKTTLENTLKAADSNREQIHAAWLEEVQAIADTYQVEIATGHLSDTWQVNSGLGKDDFRAIYEDKDNEALLALEALDERTQDYGVGPSNMEHFKPRNPYDVQAETFLTSNGLKFRATLSDSKQCPWQESYKPHYRVTISRGKSPRPICSGTTLHPDRLAFDFWGNDAKPYSVLACISSDVHCPDTFEDFCSEYGYEEDSRKAFQVFQRASKFADRLRAFFTSSEVDQLSEIR